MFRPFKHVWSSVVWSFGRGGAKEDNEGLVSKFEYGRPAFLGLSADELQVAADHSFRAIIVPREISRLPWNAGYAEVINSGKSVRNEDQAACEVFQLVDPDELPSATSKGRVGSKTANVGLDPDAFAKQLLSTTADHEERKVAYFAVFDGHAGSGASVFASRLLHFHLQEKLSIAQELLYKRLQNGDVICDEMIKDMNRLFPDIKHISTDELVIGALERAFQDMDVQIGVERHVYKISGGCTVIVAIFFLGKLYVANAGDCRAVLVHAGKTQQLSRDHSPEAERQRLQYLAWLKPHLLGNDFCHLEFQRRLTREDVGRQVLYRDQNMTGWAYKMVAIEDTKFPLIADKGKKARVLATIGPTRGLGDHDLRVFDTNLYVKPFLSSVPEVEVIDLSTEEYGPDDVVILASDGLWDVTSNETAAEIVMSTLSKFSFNELSRYTSAAQDLAMHARGLLQEKSNWKTRDDKPASGDDITVFIVPLSFHKEPAKTTVPTSASVLSKSSSGVPKDWMSPVMAAIESEEGLYASGDSGIAENDDFNPAEYRENFQNRLQNDDSLLDYSLRKTLGATSETSNNSETDINARTPESTDLGVASDVGAEEAWHDFEDGLSESKGPDSFEIAFRLRNASMVASLQEDQITKDILSSGTETRGALNTNEEKGFNCETSQKLEFDISNEASEKAHSGASQEACDKLECGMTDGDTEKSQHGVSEKTPYDETSKQSGNDVSKEASEKLDYDVNREASEKPDCDVSKEAIEEPVHDVSKKASENPDIDVINKASKKTNFEELEHSDSDLEEGYV